MNLREVGRGTLWFAIGAIVIAGAIFLLQLQIGSRHDAVTIRSYQVNPEIAEAMRSALRDALNNSVKDGSQLGRVSLTADGRLLVTAPDSIQGSVESVLAEVAAKQPTATPSIFFEIWLVSAAPGTATAAENGSGLVEVGPALADIQKSQGPLRFSLVEKLALRARAGTDDSSIQGAHFGMRLRPTVRHDSKGNPVIAAGINLDVNPEPGPFIPRSLKALAELRPGQLLVLGQSGLQGKANANADATPESQVYYIVRATL
jgi:hypothetical protein